MPIKKDNRVARKIDIVERKLGRNNALGLWQPSIKKGHSTISIDERLSGFQRLLIIIHEAVHEICPEWPEDKVIKESEILAGIIWKCNYRHVDHLGSDVPSYKIPTAKKKTKTTVLTYEPKRKKVSVSRDPRTNKTLG